MPELSRCYLAICTFFLLSSPVLANSLWQAESTNRSINNPTLTGHIYRLDQNLLEQRLQQAPMEGNHSDSITIELPVVSGRIERFSLVESPIMQSGLSARYPEIKTFKVYGIDDPQASGRISLSAAGFHGMITSPAGTFYIDPEGDDTYLAFLKSNLKDSEGFNCGVDGHTHRTPVGSSQFGSRLQRTAGSLRVYRTAVAGTEEFVDDSASGGTKAGAMTTVTNIINRINQIFERDLGVRLQLVNNTDNLLFETGDPFSNGNASAMLSENQTVVDNTIGSSNYDIAHVFGTGGGGVAFLGVACNNSFKAQGVSNGFGFASDVFAIDLAAHEFGHQFQAEHSFNATTNSCSGANRSASAAYEPGSGSTIMAYSGICGAENVQNNSDALFHAKSIEAINTFTTSGGGANCGTLLALSNPNEPTADAGIDVTIPISTPFVLTADGSDADGDTLSYTWDQIDNGTATTSANYGTDLGDNPLMRSYLPRSTKSRFFPQFQTLLDGSTDKAETLPTQTRDLTFRMTTRDGKSGLGTDDVVISSTSTAGPFVITSQSSAATLSGGDTQSVTWNVANTDQAPVSCANVDIELMMFDASKENYCTESLASSTANDGSESITLPDLSISKARIRVSCSDSVFYALSTADLALNGSSPATTSCNSVASESEVHQAATGGGGTGGSGGGSTGGGSGGSTESGSSSGSSSSGGGSLPPVSLLILLVLFARRNYHLI